MIVVEGSHVPGSVWPAAVIVCGGEDDGPLEMGMLTRFRTGSCLAAAGGSGAWVVAGGGSWFGLASGLGRCLLGLRQCVCGVVCVRLGAGLGLGSALGLGFGSRLRSTPVWRGEGAGAGLGVFPVCCPAA